MGRISAVYNWVKENWRNIRLVHIFYFLLSIPVLYLVGGEIIYNCRKMLLPHLSPATMVNIYEKAWFRNDYDFLRKIVHPDSEIIDSEIVVNENLSPSGKNERLAVKIFSVAFGIKSKAGYQKIIDEHSAEVGLVQYSIYRMFFPKEPVSQLVLKQHNGIWKIMKYKYISGQMLKKLKDNPSDASLYYLYSNDIMNEHFLSYRFKKRYYELEPDGFWVTQYFIEKLKSDEEQYETNYKEYEKKLLAEIKNYSSGMKARNYVKLSRIFMFHQNSVKAKKYLSKAEEALRDGRQKYVFVEEIFNRALHEFELYEDGKDIDIFDELEKKRLGK